jgi:hypothetical protein
MTIDPQRTGQQSAQIFPWPADPFTLNDENGEARACVVGQAFSLRTGFNRCLSERG